MICDIITNIIVIVLLLANWFVLYYVVRKQRKIIEQYGEMFKNGNRLGF